MSLTGRSPIKIQDDGKKTVGVDDGDNGIKGESANENMETQEHDREPMDSEADFSVILAEEVVKKAGD